eukprot:9784777-Alexandrium_andersonii.AAC.1
MAAQPGTPVARLLRPGERPPRPCDAAPRPCPGGRPCASRGLSRAASREALLVLQRAPCAG